MLPPVWSGPMSLLFEGSLSYLGYWLVLWAIFVDLFAPSKCFSKVRRSQSVSESQVHLYSYIELSVNIFGQLKQDRLGVYPHNFVLPWFVVFFASFEKVFAWTEVAHVFFKISQNIYFPSLSSPSWSAWDEVISLTNKPIYVSAQSLSLSCQCKEKHFWFQNVGKNGA